MVNKTHVVKRNRKIGNMWIAKYCTKYLYVSKFANNLQRPFLIVLLKYEKRWRKKHCSVRQPKNKYADCEGGLGQQK